MLTKADNLITLYSSSSSFSGFWVEQPGMLFPLWLPIVVVFFGLKIMPRIMPTAVHATAPYSSSRLVRVQDLSRSERLTWTFCFIVLQISLISFPPVWKLAHGFCIFGWGNSKFFLELTGKVMNGGVLQCRGDLCEIHVVLANHLLAFL